MMAISTSLRFTILERDGFRCVYCGKTAKEAELVVDHITPVAAGGNDLQDNLVTACCECNAGKGCRPLQDAMTGEDLVARQEHLELFLRGLQTCSDLEEEIVQLRESSAWRIVEHWQKTRGEWDEKADHITCSKNLLAHMRSLVARIEFEKLLDCVDIALAKMHSGSETNALRYLYGVIRNVETSLEDVT